MTEQNPLTPEQQHDTAQRIMHDAELLKGGAHISELGSLAITETQWDDLHADTNPSVADSETLDPEEFYVTKAILADFARDHRGSYGKYHKSYPQLVWTSLVEGRYGFSYNHDGSTNAEVLDATGLKVVKIPGTPDDDDKDWTLSNWAISGKSLVAALKTDEIDRVHLFGKKTKQFVADFVESKLEEQAARAQSAEE